MDGNYDRVMATSAWTDEELAGAAASGNEQAFAQIYERYSTPLFDFACRLLRNRADAGDVVQVTMTNAWRSLSRRRPDSKLKPWLFSIAHNAAMDVIRKRRPTEAIDESQEEGYAIASEGLEVGATLESTELATDVWSAAAALSPTEYAVLHHELRAELSADEIAQVTGMAKGAVYTAISRAKASFEEAFMLLQLVRQGRADCKRLEALLSGTSPRSLDKPMRRAVKAHLKGCEICTENSRRFVAPHALFSTIPPIAAPDGLVDIGAIVEHGSDLGSAVRRIQPSRPPKVLIAVGVAVISVAVIAAIVLAGGDAAEPPAGASATGSQDLVPPNDPSDVASTSHEIGRLSSDRVVTMMWSPAEDPASGGEEPSGLGGYSHSWTEGSDSLPPDEITLGPEATEVQSPELGEGQWWFHLRTFDQAGNNTKTVHVGPFVISSRERITCAGTSSHPYWQANPVDAIVLLRDGTVRVRVSSTPEGSGFLSDSAAAGALKAEGRADGRTLSVELKPSDGGAEGTIRTESFALRSLSDNGNDFYVFPRCRIPKV